MCVVVMHVEVVVSLCWCDVVITCLVVVCGVPCLMLLLCCGCYAFIMIRCGWLYI